MKTLGSLPFTFYDQSELDNRKRKHMLGISSYNYNPIANLISKAKTFVTYINLFIK